MDPWLLTTTTNGAYSRSASRCRPLRRLLLNHVHLDLDEVWECHTLRRNVESGYAITLRACDWRRILLFIHTAMVEFRGRVGPGARCGIRRKLSIGFRKRCGGTVEDHPMIGGCDNEHEGDSDNEAHELAELALEQVFVDAQNHDRDRRFTIARKLLFTKTFKQLITRPSPNALTKFALDLINDEFKSTSVNLAQCGQAFM